MNPCVPPSFRAARIARPLLKRYRKSVDRQKKERFFRFASPIIVTLFPAVNENFGVKRGRREEQKRRVFSCGKNKINLVQKICGSENSDGKEKEKEKKTDNGHRKCIIINLNE